MITLGNRERSALLVLVTQYLGRLKKGSFDYKQVLNIAEWMLWRIEKLPNERYEAVLLRGLITLDEYVFQMLKERKGKRLKQIAEDWYGMEDYGKHFGDF